MEGLKNQFGFSGGSLQSYQAIRVAWRRPVISGTECRAPHEAHEASEGAARSLKPCHSIWVWGFRGAASH